MNSKVFILQKDLPDGSIIGDIYEKRGDQYYNTRILTESRGIIESANWFTWQVENNPEWFKEEKSPMDKAWDKFCESDQFVNGTFDEKHIWEAAWIEVTKHFTEK